MCEPVSASLAIAAIAASSAYTGIQQDRRAKALNRYQEELYDVNAASAKQAALTEFQAIDRRQQEERRRAADASGKIARQARLSAGAALASSEGTAGGSVAALIGAFEARAAEEQSSVDFNLESVEQQLSLERKGVRAREAERINSAIPNPVPGADWLGLALNTTANILAFKTASQ